MSDPNFKMPHTPNARIPQERKQPKNKLIIEGKEISDTMPTSKKKRNQSEANPGHFPNRPRNRSAKSQKSNNQLHQTKET